jgi:cytidylate kinase
MPVIAVDGPAASGKGTLGKRLADHFGFHHLDTGLLYRAVAAQVRDRLDDRPAAIRAARGFDPAWLGDPELRTEEMGAAASKVSAEPEIRAALLAFQRDFAARPPGAVLDGRDIGTVICPDARVKLFVTASVEVRAGRRLRELQARGKASIYAAVLQDLIERDARDSERATAPLKAAADALVLDTSRMDPDEVFVAALSLIDPILA